ncbi:MAG: sulfurtransferase TusA family protein [Deltaproteobacteria bacterium]|nr:sulfurtransferase TusA family protein [Deltaproteobacteria bacterium]
MDQEALANVKADIVLDTRGLSCPMPILRVKKELKGMQPGKIVEVWSTDPGSKKDMEDFATKQGEEYLGYIDEQGYTRYLIKKGG